MSRTESPATQSFHTVCIVKDYVRARRQSTREAFVPLHHPPGHAQVDFGEAVVEVGGTGLLEAGVELHVIQRRLGHSSIRSTMRYLHLAHDKTSATPSPLDLLEFPRAGQS